MNQRLTQLQIQAIFREVFTRHLDKLDGVAASERLEPDFNPDDSRRSDRVAGWAYRALETRGTKASVDARLRESMAADGLSERDIDDVAAMLATMQRQDLAAERPERLKAIVEKVGGEPNRLNLGLAQEAVHRALADANFQTARRYDGLRTETAMVIDGILAKRAIDSDTSETKSSAREIGIEGKDANRYAATKLVEAKDSSGAREIPVTRTEEFKTEGAIDVMAPSPPVAVAARTRGQPKAHPVVTLGEKLIAKHQADGAWDVKTQKQARQIFRVLGKMLAEQAVTKVESLTQRHFADLVDILSEIPTSYGKSPKDENRTLEELRALGAAKPPAERGVKAGTLNRHLTFLGQLLVFIRGQGFKLDRDIDLSLLRANTRAVRGREKRAIFSSADLTAIFNLACFTGCADWKGAEAFTPGPELFHRALYFATILLYYTGARREEICGLTVDDVQTPELIIDGAKRLVACVFIRKNEARRIKNAQSMRLIALMPEVIRLGFLEYVEEIRKLGYRLVFPDLKSPTSNSPMGDRLYDELKRGIDLVIPDATARKKVLHSFRKTFGDSLKQAGVHAEIRGDILGHAGGTVTEEIYCDPIALSAMLEHLGKLPIVTAHLEPRPTNLLPWVAEKSPAPFARRRAGK